MTASGGCEEAIRGLMEPGGLVDLFVDVAVKGFVGGTAELLKAFFDALLGPVAALARPLFAAFLEKVGGRGAVSHFSQKLLDFVQRARAAAQCLDQFDDVWKEAAKRADVDIDTLKQVVRLLSGKGEEEILSRVEELEESLKKVERQIRAISISPDATYFYSKDWLAGREEDGRLKLCNVFMGDCGRGIYVEYVSNKLEEAVVEEVRKRAVEGGGLIVVKGAKGIGKSTAVQVALYRVLQLPLKVGGQYYKPVVVAIETYSKDEAEKFIHIAKEELRILPIFYLDPSKSRDYPKEPTGLYQPEMSIEELRSLLDKLRDVTGGVAVVILSNDQYQVVKGLVDNAEIIDADQLLASEKEQYVQALVKNYSSCFSDGVKGVAKAVASSFVDNYAVAAVVAADWLKSGKCRGEEVEKAVERARGNVLRFILDYLWHGLFNGDEAMAERYAPLLLAVGLFGPHPPKLAKAIVRAFGKEPEDAVIRWFSQPLHGTLYETIRKIVHGAVYRRFSVGSNEHCQGSGGGPCRLVEICSEALVGVPRKRYGKVEEVAEEYAKVVAERLKALGPTGVRQIDLLVDDFLQVFNGVAEDGRWRIRYDTEGLKNVKVVEDVVDELDILLALYGLAILPVWPPQPLERWFFVGSRKVNTLGLYLYFLLRERRRELVRRAVVIVNKIAKRGFFADMDLWQTMGVAAASRWDGADDEELEKAMELAAIAIFRYATASAIILVNIWPLLSEGWYRVLNKRVYKDRKRRQGLADKLIKLIYNAVKGHPYNLPLFFAVGVDELDSDAVARRFDALYKAASNAGKLLLLDALLYTSYWDIDSVNIASMLLGKPKFMPWETFEDTFKRIEEFASHLDGVEKAYAVAHLYPRVATWYASYGELDKALKFVEEALKALNDLRNAYKKDGASMEKKLRPYLELKWVWPNLRNEIKELSWHVYSHVAFVYLDADKLDDAKRYAKRACVLAKKLGDVYYKVLSCGMLPRLKAVKSGVPPVEKFEKVWQGVSQYVEELGADAIATRLGEYLVALASTGRLSEVEIALEKWGLALELHPIVPGITYGVLSLFDDRFLERAMEHLPELAMVNLPKLADALYNAVEVGLFAEEPEIVGLAWKTLMVVYYEEKEVIKALVEVIRSDKFFLSALVGLAYCKRGEEWGLRLAKAVAQVGSRAKGISGRLFGELAKALEGVTVGNCVTDEVLKAVYKLYYRYV